MLASRRNAFASGFARADATAGNSESKNGNKDLRAHVATAAADALCVGRTRTSTLSILEVSPNGTYDQVFCLKARVLAGDRQQHAAIFQNIAPAPVA